MHDEQVFIQVRLLAVLADELGTRVLLRELVAQKRKVTTLDGVYVLALKRLVLAWNGDFEN